MTERNVGLRADAAQIFDDVHDLIAGIAAVRERHQLLTASESVEGGRITVTTDIAGALAAVTFSESIDDLSYQRIAWGTLRAAQQAASTVRHAADDLVTPLRALRDRLPHMAELGGSTPRIDPIPPPPPASLISPGEREMVASRVEENRHQNNDTVVADLVDLQHRRAQLYATAAAEGRRVVLSVNADGVLIDLRFSSGIGDLDYDEIAAAITEAAGVALAGVARKVAELYGSRADDRPTYPGPAAALAQIDLFRAQVR